MGAVEIMPPVLESDADAWALRINGAFRRSFESTIETGRLLIDAKEKLGPHGTWLPMLETKLDFSPDTAQRLMAIARDERLTNTAHMRFLPRSYSTLHALTKLSNEQFERGIAEKIIRPDMERKDVEILRPTPHRERPDESSGEAKGQPQTPAGSETADGLARNGSDGLGSWVAENPPPHASCSQDGLATPGNSQERPAGNVAMPEEASDPGSHAPPSPSEAAAPAAHMAGRVHPAGDLDFSPTPPWATRALIERVLRHAEREKVCKFQTAWEPACGEGHMAEVLRDYFRFVAATDVDPKHGYADHVGNFLGDMGIAPGHFDWIITNPPFGDNVLPFMKRALDLAGTGVAMFLQLRYLEGVERYEQLYRERPPTIVAPFVERVPLLMGKYDPEASTTTAFMWLVWLEGASPKAPFWIPPGCAKALTKPDDGARFTQRPVQKIVRTPSAPEPQAASPTPPTEAGYPDLPECLRRTA